MSREQWTAVDQLITDTCLPADAVLEAVLAAGAAAGLPPINVSPTQGKLLHLLARIQRASTILEIGTLAGYSTTWFARALPPGGRITTLELNADYAKVAQANFRRAGVADRVELRIGPALESLRQIEAERRAPFDLVFIDADKPRTAEYFDWAIRLARPGTLVIVDNVVRNGAVADAATTDEAVQGMRRFLAKLNNEPRVTATALQTVGSKGYDGFAMAIVL